MATILKLNVSRKNIASNAEEQVIGNFDEIIENEQKFRDYIADLSLQKDIKSSILEETVSQEINNTKISNENESKNSDYILSSSISTINRTKSDVSDSLNLPINNDTFPVDIRDIYVPASKIENADYSLKQYFCPYCKKLQKSLFDIWN